MSSSNEPHVARLERVTRFSTMTLVIPIFFIPSAFETISTLEQAVSMMKRLQSKAKHETFGGGLQTNTLVVGGDHLNYPNKSNISPDHRCM